MRCAERDVRVHARELAAARKEAEELRCGWDKLLFQIRGDDVESVGSANSAT